VIEIKSTGFSKGVAVRELMKIPPFQIVRQVSSPSMPIISPQEPPASVKRKNRAQPLACICINSRERK